MWLSKRHTHLRIDLQPELTCSVVVVVVVIVSHNRNAKTVQTIDPAIVPEAQNNHCAH